jgi:two-component system chemotaxis sensor kinase CheA
VSDDGAGIDLEKLKTSAIQHGHLLPADALTLGDAEARKLALQPDVSTSPMITTVSGRGLGLAIVRERAEMLGGSVSVESEPGRGTSFCITVPARLATFRGILIEAAERRFIVPTAHVEQVARVKADDVRTVEGRETIALGGRAIARARLADVLELPAIAGGGTASAMEPTIVVFAGDQRVALAVDAVLGEQEVLVKRFSLPLVRVRNVSGATVLASGQVVPVLNVADLLKSSQRNGGAAARSPALPKPSSPVAKAILVVEDSITSRTMIKSILESAGHRVETAVDGMDALTKLRSAKFDLVVSDVEMPRLNGLDLTARIRADKRLADLPVVLLTARETREDRERGIDVGANAYLVKSGFDQDDLLDAVRRLA